MTGLLSTEEVFGRVAARYDLMNDLMSAGMHRLWKRAMVDRIAPNAKKLIDIASGTGDIAVRALRQNKSLTALCGDPSLEMLAQLANRKAGLDTDKRTRLHFAQFNGTHLPCADNSFDTYTISFGIRNVQDRAAALSEAHRVLGFGGKFLCLEFNSQVAAPIAPLYQIYNDKIIPALGKKIMGDSESYRYLAETIKTFPTKETFATMVTDAGFSKITLTPLTAGIVVLYQAYKI